MTLQRDRQNHGPAPPGLSPGRRGYGAGMRAAVVILVVGIVALIAALLLVGPGAAASGPVNIPRIDAPAVDGWERGWHAALARAGRDDRPLLILFTGSDWCTGCVQLRRDVLD